MKKKSIVWVKLIIFCVIAITFILAGTGYADLVVFQPSPNSIAEKFSNKQIELNTTIHKNIDLFEKKKTLTPKEKNEFIITFKNLLIKSVELNNEITSDLNSGKYKKEDIDYYKNPDMPQFNDDLSHIISTQEWVIENENKLKLYLNKLGISDFSFLPEQNIQMNKSSTIKINNFSLLSLSGFALLMVLTGFSFLKFIRSKK